MPGRNKIYKSLKRIFQEPSGEHFPVRTLAIAGLHATILSIMFAFIIAYSIFIMGYFAEMEIEIIRMAGKVNEIKFISPSYGNFPFKEPYTPNNSGNREKLD